MDNFHDPEYQERFYKNMADGLVERARRMRENGYEKVADNLCESTNFYLAHAYSLAVMRRETEATT